MLDNPPRESVATPGIVVPEECVKFLGWCLFEHGDCLPAVADYRSSTVALLKPCVAATIL
jgi:hypothetical protein